MKYFRALPSRINSKAILLAAALGAALSLPSLQAAENLLANGSFELGQDPGGSTQLDAGSTGLDGWIIDSGNLDYIGNRWVAADGGRCLDLSGSVAGTISQEIRGLSPGQRYRLSFQMAANPEAPPPTTDLLVSIGATADRFTVTVVGTVSDLRWQPFHSEFVATAESMDLRLSSLNPGWAGPALDALELSQVDTATLVYDLSRDYSLASNPNGVWSYGSKSALEGEFTPLSFARVGTPQSWEFQAGVWPAIYKNNSQGTIFGNGGQSVFPSGSVWLAAGENGSVRNFGVIRFTVPPGGSGSYLIESRARSGIVGPVSSDADFYVVQNGAEIFGVNCPASSVNWVGYSNALVLAEGDTIDLMTGRGADRSQPGSVLIVEGFITAISTNGSTTPPEIRSQPSNVAATVGQTVSFSVNVIGAIPLSYQWYHGEVPLAAGTNRTLSVANVGFGDAGAYQVVVTNSFGSVTSSVATLSVNYPAARVQVVSVDALAVGPVQVPVQLVANGNENAVAFSLNYDAARLSFVSAELGAGATGGTLLVNDSSLANGRVGLSVALPAGSTFAAGTQAVVAVTFTTGGVPSVQRLPVQFGDEPVVRQLSDATAETLAAVYTAGSISVSPTAVQAGAVETVTGGVASLPVSLRALGTENAVSFSLGYNKALLAFSGVQAGADLPPDASILVNTSQAAAGQVGISVALPAGATFPRGVRAILQANFDVATVLQPVTTQIRFGDSPTVRQVANVNAQSIPATYGTGSVSVVSVALEADIAPRSTGDQALTVIDWVQAGRFAAALDVVEPGEFQRVDCAPREGRGNGVISVADWVQAGRYSAGLDPVTGIGGPSEPVMALAGLGGGGGGGGNSDCVVRISNTNVLPGSTVNVPVQVAASGTENALGFSLVFDASKLRFVGATKLGAIGAATLNVNTNQASAGRVGVVFALPTGNVLTAGNQDVLLITLAAAPAVSGSTTVSFGDSPVVREAVSATARTVSSSFTPGEIVLGPPLVVGPPMSIVRSSESVVIFWSAAEAGYELQASDAPRGQTWSTVTASPIEIGGQKIVTLPRTGSQKYFRLRKP